MSWRASAGCGRPGVALRFGGGGHPAAAGAEIVGSLEEVQNNVLQETRKLLEINAPQCSRVKDRIETMNTDQIDNIVSGVLVVDKPIGLTSHDVVQIIRRGTGIRRAGHTGTLDPRASGVLVVLIGPAVRLSEYVSASDKRYQATVRLGSSTDTYDADGTINSPTVSVDNIDEELFDEILQTVCW